jgi:hypothetical protein
MSVEEQRRERERQREHQSEQQRLQQAFNQNGDLDKGWLDELLTTEDLEDELDTYQIRKIRALINKQAVLSKLSKAQVHDRWYKLEVIKFKILAEFPPEESAIQGRIRAFLKDDPYEELNALTAEERTAIDQIIMTLQNMVTRSSDGFERKQINTNIAKTESETQNRSEDNGGMFGGLF